MTATGIQEASTFICERDAKSLKTGGHDHGLCVKLIQTGNWSCVPTCPSCLRNSHRARSWAIPRASACFMDLSLDTVPNL